MRREYLEPLCKRRAEIIFQEALNLYGYPQTLENINRMKEYCYARCEGYNHIEKALVEEHLKKLLQDYVAELLDYNAMYQ